MSVQRVCLSRLHTPWFLTRIIGLYTVVSVSWPRTAALCPKQKRSRIIMLQVIIQKTFSFVVISQSYRRCQSSHSQSWHLACGLYDDVSSRTRRRGWYRRSRTHRPCSSPRAALAQDDRFDKLPWKFWCGKSGNISSEGECRVPTLYVLMRVLEFLRLALS